MIRTMIDDADINKINIILNKHNFDKSALLQILSEVQDIFGYLPRDALDFLAKQLSVSLSKIWGVITFYAFFKVDPPAKFNISICEGTACHVAGAARIADFVKSELKINFGEHTPDGLFSLQSVACIGACGLAPNIVINGKTYGRQTVKSVDRLLKKLRRSAK